MLYLNPLLIISDFQSAYKLTIFNVHVQVNFNEFCNFCENIQYFSQEVPGVYLAVGGNVGFLMQKLVENHSMKLLEKSASKCINGFKKDFLTPFPTSFFFRTITNVYQTNI